MKNDKRFLIFRAIHERPLSLSRTRKVQTVAKKASYYGWTGKISWTWETRANADELPSASERDHHHMKGMRMVFASIRLSLRAPAYIDDRTGIWQGTSIAKERERGMSSGMSEHLREAPSVSRGCNARKNKVYKSPWPDMSANFLVSRVTMTLLRPQRFTAGTGRREPNATERELFILCRLSRVGITAGKFNRRSPEASRNDPL